MPTKQEIEEFRKTAVLYSVASQKPLMAMMRTGQRDEQLEKEYLRLQSEASVAAMAIGRNEVIQDILAIHEPIQKAWKAYAQKTIGRTVKNSIDKDDDFLLDLGECLIEYQAAAERFDRAAALHSPIDTRLKKPQTPGTPGGTYFTKKKLCELTGYDNGMVNARLKQLGIETARGGRPKKSDKPFSADQVKALLLSIIDDDGAQKFNKDKCQKSLETL